MKPWSRPIFGWSLSCENESANRAAAFEGVYNRHFNSGSAVYGLEVKEFTATMIVLNSILFFLMLAYVNDP